MERIILFCKKIVFSDNGQLYMRYTEQNLNQSLIEVNEDIKNSKTDPSVSRCF